MHFTISKMLSAVVILLFSCITTVLTDIHERQLYEDILKGYNTLERPVFNGSDPVQVTLQLTLFQIVSMSWHDYNLKWAPEEYGGVRDVRIPPDKIWKPDVLLYNNVDADFQSYFPSNMIVESDGSILWIPPAILQSSCKIDITWFPFDDQICCLKFGSWTYNTKKLNLTQTESGWDLSEYLENGEWLLIGTPVMRTVRLYACCPDEPYADVHFCLQIRRRTLYYGVNMILPSVLISLMTLLSFLLPVESGEKLTLEITILLSVCVFLTMVGQMTPTTSEAVPVIGVLFSVHMIIVSTSVVFNVLVLNLHYRSPDTHRMGKLTRKLLLRWLPKLLLMKPPGSCAIIGKEKEPLLSSASTKNDIVPLFGQHELAICQELRELRRTAHAVLRNTREIRDQMQKGSLDEEARNEWRFAAMVVDRICLVVFSLAIAISTFGIFSILPRSSA